MNADQKKRIAHEISNWKNACNCRAVQLTGDRMAALLQELADAPETEPVARVTGYYAGYLSIATIDGRVLFAGTALYAAPPHQSEHHLEMVNTPAPSVPDGWKLVPVEPTPEMIDAWNNDDSDEFRHAYHVMLEAAPQPPKLSDERIREIWIEYGLDDEDVEGFARAIEREILGGGHD